MPADTDYSGPVRAAARRHGITPAQYQAHIDANEKWCRACSAWQPRTDYKPSASTYDQLRPLCQRHYTPAPPKPIRHGRVGGYRRGCRCDECRAANARAQQNSKARRSADPAAIDRAGHGKATTYVNYGCRCDPCKHAGSIDNAARYRARKEKAA
ncbi:hypothetical protein ACFQ6Q_00175 [Streptomyces sp. NPDC056437]|uniref:hypothetical protein n=1 Tax=Streptomyces sp. NPDC056437 TaxID=3345816 RepID=UPI00369ACE9B